MQSYFKSLLYFLFVIVICSGKIANFKCDQLKLVLNCSNVTDLSFVGNLKQIEVSFARFCSIVQTITSGEYFVVRRTDSRFSEG